MRDDDSPLMHHSGDGGGSGVAVLMDAVALTGIAAAGEDLRDISAFFAPAALHAIASPFEGRASRLLHAVGGINAVDAGTIMANSLPVISSRCRKRFGFVPAFSFAVRDATVRHNLLFAARMRLADRFVAKGVTRVIDLLNLGRHEDVEVQALPTAGLRKLANIGMELVTEPDVLFLDDPLKGLSCHDHAVVVDVLRQLAHASGVTVIIAVSEMPFGLYNEIQSVVVLGERRRMLFSGGRDDCAKFFDERAHRWFRDSSAAVAVRGRRAAAVAERGGGDGGITGDDIMDVVAACHVLEEDTTVADEFAASGLAQRLRDRIANYRAPGHWSPGPPQPSALKRVLYLLHFTLRHQVTRLDFLLAWGALFLSFLLSAALSQRQQSDQYGMQNKRGIIFFLLSCAMHINVVFVDSEVSDRNVLVYLLRGAHFSAVTCFAATLIRLTIPRLAFALLGLVAAHALFSGVFGLALLIGLTSLAHAAGITLVALAVPKARLISTVVMLYYGYSVMLSGFLITTTSVPKWTTQLSLLRPGYGGAVAEELRGQPYSCDAVAVNRTASYCYTGDEYLALQGFANDSVLSDSVQLLCTTAALAVMIFIKLLNL
jgi:ABC-type multidrug transport system ATPase subunit